MRAKFLQSRNQIDNNQINNKIDNFNQQNTTIGKQLSNKANFDNREFIAASMEKRRKMKAPPSNLNGEAPPLNLNGGGANQRIKERLRTNCTNGKRLTRMGQCKQPHQFTVTVVATSATDSPQPPT